MARQRRAVPRPALWRLRGRELVRRRPVLRLLRPGPVALEHQLLRPRRRLWLRRGRLCGALHARHESLHLPLDDDDVRLWVPRRLPVVRDVPRSGRRGRVRVVRVPPGVRLGRLRRRRPRRPRPRRLSTRQRVCRRHRRHVVWRPSGRRMPLATRDAPPALRRAVDVLQHMPGRGVEPRLLLLRRRGGRPHVDVHAARGRGRPRTCARWHV